MEELSEILTADRLVKIFVGPDTDAKPFLVQQAVLETVSEYFVKALQPNNFSGGATGVLHFPEDDVDAWKMLLYWMFRGSMPTEDQNPSERDDDYRDLLIRCWAHGDRYDISVFQDLVMLELLHTLEVTATQLKVVKTAFDCTAVGSKMRSLMAEEAVALVVKDANGQSSVDDLDMLDGALGFTTALVKALATYDNSEESVFCRLWDADSNRCDGWKQFMVGKGPSQHWIYGDTKALGLDAAKDAASTTEHQMEVEEDEEVA